MCDPMTALLGVGLSMGGAGINSMIQNNAISEQNRQNQVALQRQRENADLEYQRQLDFEKQQLAEVTKALFAADPTQIRQQGDQPNKISMLPEDFNVLDIASPVHNQDVKTRNARTINDQLVKTKDRLKSMATLSNQGTAFSGLADTIQGMQSGISSIGGFRQGSANAARAETAIPGATVTASDNPLGDLLLLGGQLVAGQGGKLAGAGSKTVFPTNWSFY